VVLCLLDEEFKIFIVRVTCFIYLLQHTSLSNLWTLLCRICATNMGACAFTFSTIWLLPNVIGYRPRNPNL